RTSESEPRLNGDQGSQPSADNDGVADPIGENCCDHDPQKQSPAPSLPFERDSVRILGQGIGRDSVRQDGPQHEQFGPHQKLIANDESLMWSELFVLWSILSYG